MSLIDRIKFDGPEHGEPWLVYKYPGEDFALGSQLIVNQSQEALFFKGGEALDLFGPGTFTLKTGNLPLLDKLVNLPFGGDTPFSAEVYFINKTARLDLRWGTMTPFPVEDPKYGVLLSVRAFGQYGVTISDPRMFVTRMIGAAKGGSMTDYGIIARYFEGIINTRIKEIVSNYMIRKRISFLEITTYIGELSEVCTLAINEEFERFGVELLNFYIESVNVPKEDTVKLKDLKEKRAELNILGEDYYRRRSFDVMEKLADNPGSGGMANAAMGIGMGFSAGAAAGDAFAQLGANLMPSHPVPMGQPGFASVQQGVQQERCRKCGEHSPKGSRFCGSCGEKFELGTPCPSCNHLVAAGMKFCGSCGTAVGNRMCTGCGSEVPTASAFCGNCGTKQ
ncbi:SPFH domain-containing protein [Paenibacillus aurantiacus]|uniref:SPFH domain-containing protein n=1 Tax=Paenibacillus aurantiacus TaxID=1936118 RepID=A0ABV5KIE3_9BACL